MPKLEKFKETIKDTDLLPDFDLSLDCIKRPRCSQGHLQATLNEVLEILQKTDDCLTVKELHARFVEGFPRNNQRFARFNGNFMDGFDMVLLENAVKFLADFGYVQLEPNLGKNPNLRKRMILGVQEKVQVGLILDDEDGEEGFWMGPINGPKCSQQ